ncbi:hypothetical protein [Candidatus Nitrospira bockiana]
MADGYEFNLNELGEEALDELARRAEEAGRSVEEYAKYLLNQSLLGKRLQALEERLLFACGTVHRIPSLAESTLDERVQHLNEIVRRYLNRVDAGDRWAGQELPSIVKELDTVSRLLRDMIEGR